MTVQHPMLVLGCATASLVLSLSPTTAGAAPTKDQCVDANTRAQDLRRDGKLIDARTALQLCVADSCPKLVRADCAKRLDELEVAMPSITFEAKDGAGQDLSLVVVTVDDKPFSDQLDGSAINVDPGEHTFHFETPNQPPKTLKFVVHEGDRGRRETVTLGLPPPKLAEPPPPPSPSLTPGTAGFMSPKHKLIALSLGGAGVIGIGIGAAFGISASSHWSASKSECNSSAECPNHGAAVADRNSASNRATISTIAFVAGGAALAAGSLLFVLDWRKSREHVATLSVAPVVTPGGGGLWFVGAL